jgi:hypothetical protein
MFSPNSPIPALQFRVALRVLEPPSSDPLQVALPERRLLAVPPRAQLQVAEPTLAAVPVRHSCSSIIITERFINTAYPGISST